MNRSVLPAYISILLASMIMGCGSVIPGDEVETPDSPPVDDSSRTLADAGSRESADSGTEPPPVSGVPDREDANGDLNNGLMLGFGLTEKDRMDGPPPPLPPQVEADMDYQGTFFQSLEDLDEAPPGLTAAAMLRAIPGRYRTDEREKIESALGKDGHRGLDLAGGHLDENTMLLRYQYGAVENMFMLINGNGKILKVLHFQERTGHGLLADINGDGTREFIIDVVEGMGMSSYPESWHIYTFESGRLRKLGRIAKSFSTGSKYQTYHFYNAVTFPKKGQMRVETVLRQSDSSDLPAPMKGAPKRLGEIRTYSLSAGSMKQVSFEKGKLDADDLETLCFRLAVHFATSVTTEEATRAIEEKIQLANEHYSEVSVLLDASEEWEQLPESFAVLEEIPERHALKKRLVDRAINVFVVDEILDSRPSLATRKAAKWQGREPSGRLAGAHIEVKNRRPGTYIILTLTSPAISLTHELGHFFGLPHEKDPSNIMSYGKERTTFVNEQYEIIRSNADRTARKKLVETQE